MPLIPVNDAGEIPMGELTLADIELAGMYRVCAEWHRGLINAVRAHQ